ncbi:MAG: enoyl-CoA hydratase/isomerase family protein [Thermoanaerobaculia bacterium]|nr:enoyl-CoA hydratase/isomerase family protein [Thermoanaerobaculia bacterium]
MEGYVLHILLDRPKANLLDALTIEAISRSLSRDVTPETRMIVFEGAGDHFSFGASVEEHQAEQAELLLSSFHGLFRQLAEVAVPTCAVVRGQCLGGGLELASWCTWIVATPEARLGQPEINLAVFPPMASILLPWRAGGRAALDLCVSGRSVSADEAQQLGLVNVVTEDPESWWMDLVREQLSATSASSLRFAEVAARTQLIRIINRDLGHLEGLYLDHLMKTHDGNEGIAAFVERRRPEYTHQ